MNELIQVFRDYFDAHLVNMAFVSAGKALKNMVVLLSDAGELEVNKTEIQEKIASLEIKVPLMDFEELEKVSAILLYAKRRLAALSQGPIYGAGLSREPTAEESARILALRSSNGDRLGSMVRPDEESDSFIGDLRDDDSSDE